MVCSQVDHSTNADKKATRLAFVRYIFQEDVHEDMLCAFSLPTNTTAAELFKSLSDYISGKLNWSFCVTICMDGAAAVTGQLSGFTTWVKEISSEWESMHCVIHREMLASQKMSPELNVLPDVIKIIALAGVAQMIELWAANQSVAGSIPSQGTCLGCWPGPQ